MAAATKQAKQDLQEEFITKNPDLAFGMTPLVKHGRVSEPIPSPCPMKHLLSNVMYEEVESIVQLPFVCFKSRFAFSPQSPVAPL